MTTHRADLGAYITRFHGRLGTFKKGVLIKLFGAVIRDTPVLTGRLRGNWTFNKGSVPKTFRQDLDPTGGLATADMTAGVQSTVKAEDDHYYLANSMHYVIGIEYEGRSHTKAPEGMVRRNITRITSILARQAKGGL